LPAVILTGDLPTLLRKTGNSVAACRLLPKPVDTQALIDAISDLSAAGSEAALGTPTAEASA